MLSRDGAVLSTSELPNKPISRPVFGDFDSDGVSDVIVVTEDAILGFRLEVSQSNRGLLVSNATKVKLLIFKINFKFLHVLLDRIARPCSGRIDNIFREYQN